MDWYVREDWKCPNCGGIDLEIFTREVWITHMSVQNGFLKYHTAYPKDNKSPPDVFNIQCRTCGLSSDTDDYWHMSDTELEEEAKWEEADQQMFDFKLGYKIIN